MVAEEIYRHLLNVVPPWYVKKVAATTTSATVQVYLEQAETAALSCPLCGRPGEVCGETEQKCWHHLNTCQSQTLLLAKLPLVECPEHGRQPASFPLAEADAPVTFALARWLGELSKEIGSYSRLAAITRLDPKLLERVLPVSGKRSAPRKPYPQGDVDQHGPPKAMEQPRQLGLFSQNDMILINQGLQALRTLQVEQALEFFRKHQQVYPKGPNVESRIAVAEFLLGGLARVPPRISDRVSYLCGFWKRFVDFARIQGLPGHDRLLAELCKAYFARILTEVEAAASGEIPSIFNEIPLGYLYLQAGHHEQAVRHLQAAIPQAPHNAAVYGYLGDAYWSRGDRRIARQCYREGFLIDPAAVDWQQLKDNELNDLRHDLHLLYGFDERLAIAWVPSHARINGLLERKVVRLLDGLKELVDDYVTRQKALARGKDPIKAAELFFRGIILCENEEHLRLVKKIDPIQVRRLMKQVNSELFAEFLAMVAANR